MFRKIDRWLLRRWPRYRLRRICKAIGIKPYFWQRLYVLKNADCMPVERGIGKTTAVMLRILMIPQNNAYSWARAGMFLSYDPDWQEDRLRWYSGEYRRLKNLCLKAGIPVLQVEIYRMIREWEKMNNENSIISQSRQR